MTKVYFNKTGGTVVAVRRSDNTGRYRWAVAVKVEETGTIRSGYREHAPDLTGYRHVANTDLAPEAAVFCVRQKEVVVHVRTMDG